MPADAPPERLTEDVLKASFDDLERVMSRSRRACTDTDPCGECTGAVCVPEWDEFYGRWRAAVRKCAFAAEQERRQALAAEKRIAGIPARFADCSFDNYETTRLTKHAVDRCRAYAAEFYEGQSHGLYLVGSVGTGKTHLAAAILNTVLEAGGRGRFIVVPDWLAELRRRFGRNIDSEDLWEQVETKHLLVMDDIGTEKPSEWVEEQIYLVVNYRYQHALPTIYTSNVGLDELRERLGARTVSRIAETCDGLVLQGRDYRTRKLGRPNA